MNVRACLYIGLLASVAMLVGCNATKSASGDEMNNGFIEKEWVAEYILGQPVIDMSHTSIMFKDDGSVAGKGGCNHYSGKYTLKGSTVTFGRMATTMMMCAPALSDQEMRFFKSLAKPLTIKMENGLLHLVPAEGEPSVFAIHN